MKSYCSLDIEVFVFPSFPLFFCPCLLLEVIENKSKVYDIINCLNKMLLTHLLWYLDKEKRYDIETLTIDGVLNKQNFYGKIMQKISTKTVPDSLFNFDK